MGFAWEKPHSFDRSYLEVFSILHPISHAPGRCEITERPSKTLRGSSDPKPARKRGVLPVFVVVRVLPVRMFAGV